MIDIKLVRQNLAAVKQALALRNSSWIDLVDELSEIDKEYRLALQEKEELEAQRNQLSKEVGLKKSQKQDAEREIEQLNTIKAKLKNIADKEPQLSKRQKDLLESIPNIPDSTTPVGRDETENQVVYEHGVIPRFDFEVLDHDEIGRRLDILDFERGVKLAQSRFTLVKGLGAKLERALINFMLDSATRNGYIECIPPILVNSESLFGTGQLPKFREDLYKVEGDDLFLIPTAEVPLTNIYRDEILDESQLPISFCAYTPNFRSEAGAASKDTRGIIRQHQFNKIELVKISHPDFSAADHEQLTKDAESILQALELPYRKLLLCTGDIGFGAAKCYDLEVWFPGQAKYREISSCSNFKDFQARRAKIRFKSKDSKPSLVHTINGSGLAVGRTLAAILENYQNLDGTVRIPRVLEPYLTRV